MKKKRTLLLISMWLLFANVAFEQTAAPDKPPKSVNEIKAFIKKANSDDLKERWAAQEELSEITGDSIPNLWEILKKEEPCTAISAASLITKLNPNYPELVPKITKLVRGGNISTLEEEMSCRRQAANLLLASSDGLRSILDLLKGDDWEKATALFALDDFADVADEADYQRYPGQMGTWKAIIPVVAKLQSSKDKTVRSMSGVVLNRLSHAPKELSESAKKLVIDLD